MALYHIFGQNQSLMACLLYTSVLTWATAPYVALLCIVGHKEARFLFPLAPFLPFFVVIALASEPLLGARLASFLSLIHIYGSGF